MLENEWLATINIALKFGQVSRVLQDVTNLAEHYHPPPNVHFGGM